MPFIIMSTAPPAYPKLAEEPKQDEPEIDTPEREGLLSQDIPYPPPQFWSLPSTFPTHTVTMATRQDSIPCSYRCLFVYVALSVFICCPIGYIAGLFFRYALHEHRNGRHNNHIALTISFIVATVALVSAILIVTIPVIVVFANN